MKPIEQLLGGALLFELPRFDDDRGSFLIPFRADDAAGAGLPELFVQDNQSLSRQAGTVRGLHLQLPPWEQGKLLRVLRGRLLDVFVDLRPGSPTHARHDTVDLTAGDDRLLWVPPGFAHGFVTLEPDTEVLYKVDAPYRPEAELSVRWNDDALGIDWGVTAGEAIVSAKDRDGVALRDAVARIAEATAANRASRANRADGPDRVVGVTTPERSFEAGAPARTDGGVVTP